MRLQTIKKTLNQPRYSFIKNMYNALFPVRGRNNVVIRNSRYCNLKLKIVGNNNVVRLGKGSVVISMPLTIFGSNNYIEIGEGVIFAVKGTIIRLSLAKILRFNPPISMHRKKVPISL